MTKNTHAPHLRDAGPGGAPERVVWGLYQRLPLFVAAALLVWGLA